MTEPHRAPRQRHRSTNPVRSTNPARRAPARRGGLALGLAGLLLAGCAGTDVLSAAPGTASPTATSTASSGASTAPMLSPAPGSAPATAPVTGTAGSPASPTVEPLPGGRGRFTTKRGTLRAGKESGCLLLATDDGLWALSGPQRARLQPGMQVEVTGAADDTPARTCQQGRPFLLTGVEVLSAS